MCILTNNQKNLARWLVKNVRDGGLDEEFSLHVIKPMDSISPKFMFENYRGTIEELNSVNVTKGSLRALIDGKLLNCQHIQLPVQEIWHCILTGSIYKAVDSDFNSPDASFIDYLTPLANPSGFDEELARRCFPVLTTGGSNPDSWDTAVRNAGVVLEERLRDVGFISDPNRVGRSLVNDIFNKNGTLAAKFSVDSERDGYRDLYSGIVGVFRNPSAHRFIDPSPEEGGAFIVFVNLLLKKLEDLR